MWLVCILILYRRITRLAWWHISRNSILLWWHISRDSILLWWHISRNSILLRWHISRNSRLTVLLGWHKTRLRCTKLSLWHILVWIHSTWLSIYWLRRHTRLRYTKLSLLHIWVRIHSTWLSIHWLRSHYCRLNKRLSLRYIVLIHSCLSKILRIVEVLRCIVVLIILRMRGIDMMIFYCFNFFYIITRVLGLTFISENYSTNAAANTTENN